MTGNDHAGMDFDAVERRARFGKTIVDHHVAVIGRRIGPVRIGMTSSGHDPELAYAAAEALAGRGRRGGPRWYEGRPDQVNFWGMWAFFMLGFAGYCIDNEEWFGVVLFSVLTVTSCISATTAWLHRKDDIWQARAQISVMQAQPKRAPGIAKELSREAADNAEALGAIGDWAYEQCEWGNAEEACRRYIGVVADDARAVLRLADIQLHRGKAADALNTLAHAQSLADVSARDDILWRTMAARLIAGEGRRAREAMASADLSELGEAERDWVAYLGALAVATTQGIDGRAEAAETLDGLVTRHPAHPRFTAVRDMLRSGGEIAITSAIVLDCDRVPAAATNGAGIGAAVGV